MSPAIGDIDLIGFYPSLSRDGAMVSGKPSDSNASVTLIKTEAFGHNIHQSFWLSWWVSENLLSIVAFFMYVQEMVLGQPRGTYVIYKEETK